MRMIAFCFRMLLNLNMIKPEMYELYGVPRFQDVVKFEYDKTIITIKLEDSLFQDVVKFEYDKTYRLKCNQLYQFQDVVKFEYDKTQ